MVQCVYGTDSFYKVSCLEMVLIDVQNRVNDLIVSYSICEDAFKKVNDEKTKEFYKNRLTEIRGLINEFEKVVNNLKNEIKKERMKNVRN